MTEDWDELGAEKNAPSDRVRSIIAFRMVVDADGRPVKVQVFGWAKTGPARWQDVPTILESEVGGEEIAWRKSFQG